MNELEKLAWGVWVDYKIAPPGSYACLVSRFMDNRWTDPEPKWMPAQLRPQLHGEVRVMPYLMPNDPLAAVNALPELVAERDRLRAENAILKAALPETFAGWVWTEVETAQLRLKHEEAAEHKGFTEFLYAMAAEGIRIARARAMLAASPYAKDKPE